MTVRITLRLPDAVFERVAQASAASGMSKNQVIVDALWEAELASKRYQDMTPQERMNWELREAGRPYTEDELADLLFDSDDADEEDDRELTHEELWELMPKLPPEKWLSKAVIEDREDRF